MPYELVKLGILGPNGLKTWWRTMLAMLSYPGNPNFLVKDGSGAATDLFGAASHRGQVFDEESYLDVKDGRFEVGPRGEEMYPRLGWCFRVGCLCLIGRNP